MARYGQTIASRPYRDPGRVQVNPNQESLADLIDNFTMLPQEIWDQIHVHILEDLDISTTLESYNPSNWELLDAECEYNGYEAGQLYILQWFTLTIIKYYESLFATSYDWKPPVWENHVRFVFPSVLAMGDAFTAYQAAGCLDQIRRVKVFSKGVMAHDPRNQCAALHLYVDTVLNVFSDLKLDHLEYEDTHPLLRNWYGHPSSIEVSDVVPSVCLSPGWKRLTILGSQHHFDGQIVDQLISQFRETAETDPTDEYTFDLPDTPTIKNGNEIVGLDVDKRPKDAKQVYYGSGVPDVEGSKPSWLSGISVCPQIVLTRKQYGIRRPPLPYRDAINVMREWTQNDGWTWNRLRRLKIIQYE